MMQTSNAAFSREEEEPKGRFTREGQRAGNLPCNRLTEERDEAERQLKHIKRDTQQNTSCAEELSIKRASQDEILIAAKISLRISNQMQA
ncbi:hypothetical protein PAMP_023320 [Pampus punctatissimus]